jgi:hypothetical protein
MSSPVPPSCLKALQASKAFTNLWKSAGRSRADSWDLFVCQRVLLLSGPGVEVWVPEGLAAMLLTDVLWSIKNN